ncbi:MAG: hypothetical protein AAF204_02360, partial [Pseudomonadota bacterium]
LVALGADSSALQALEEENATLKSQLAAMETEKGQAETLLTRISNLEEENAALSEQIENAPEPGENIELATLRSENDALKAQIANKDIQIDRIAVLEGEVERLKLANDDLQAAASNDTLDAQLQTALDANTAMSAKIDDKDAKLATLETQHTEMKTVLADVVALAETYKEENAAQKAQIASLEQDIENASEAALAMAQEQKAAEVELQEPKAEPKKEPKPLLEEASVEPQTESEAAPVKIASASVPTPSRKPAAPARQPDSAPSEPLPLTTTGEDEGLYERMASIEAQMRDTDVNDQARMQALAQEYMAVKTQIERQEYAAQTSAASPENVLVSSAEAASEKVAGIFEEIPQQTAEEIEWEEQIEDLSGLSEAQIQERAMKRAKLDAQREIQRRAAQEAMLVEKMNLAEAPQAPVVQEENITLSQSADPFEGLEAEAQEMASADVIDLKELTENTPQPERVEVESAPVALSEAEEALDDIPVVAAPEPMSVKTLITQAQVSTVDKIKRVDGESADFDVAYQWNGGSVYGSAEQKVIASADQFDTLVQDYLERTQTRCPGEFAIVPDNTVDRGAMRADSYEVACVGDNVSSGASLLFFNQGDTFTVVAHEAPAEELGAAMNYRNKLMRFITGS